MSLFSGFEHAAIAASDAKGLVDWYVAVFGLRVVHEGGGAYLLAAGDGTIMEIIPADTGGPREYGQREAGLRHLAFSVRDFDAALAHLKKRGVGPFFDYRQSEEARLIFFRDPEGNILHLAWRAGPLYGEGERRG